MFKLEEQELKDLGAIITTTEIKQQPELWAQAYEIYKANKENLNNIVFTVIDDGEDKGTITLPLMGIHNVENSLLAYGAAKILGLTIDDMQKGLENLECTSMRLDVIEAHGKTIIDDSYNASPDSMKAALNVLKQFNGRKIAVLGTMKELGDESKN